MPRAQTSRTSSGEAKKPPSAPTTDGGGGVMRMTVYFQQAEWDALQARAAKEDTTLASLVRRAVQAHLKLA